MKRILLLSAVLIVAVFATISLGYPSLVQPTVTGTQSTTPQPQPSQTTSTDSIASENTAWTLSVTGLVENPLNITLDEIFAMPKTTVNAEIYCVDYPQTPVSEGDWTGVRLGLILENAGVLPEAIKVAFIASGGYTTDLSISTAMQENIIIAYELNGESLPFLRLVVPGQWGYKWINALHTVELVDYDFLGKWESQGYPDDANIND